MKHVTLVVLIGLLAGVSYAQEPPPPDGARGGPPSSGGRGGPQRYSLEQAASDNAQLHTIAFSGLAFITGDYGACTFMPPGKVCDFFGFQYMRDIDAAQKGHNPMFLDRVAGNVLQTLTVEQRAVFEKAARQEAEDLRTIAQKRLPLIKAFRRQLAGDIPAGSKGLDQEAVAKYVGDFFAFDAEVSYRRAQIFGQVAASFTAEQKQSLAKMKFGDFNTWPAVNMDQYKLPRGTEKMVNVAYMTYASEFFSWYAGSLDADVYFCPERHGTYFGGFYMKDMPAMGKRDFDISTSVTGDSGKEFINTLTPEQARNITAIPDLQRSALKEVIDTRRAIATELRMFLKGEKPDKDKVVALGRRYGELDGTMSYYYATAFAAVNKALTAEQRKTLAKLRNLDGYTSAPAYIYSDALKELPALPDTDFFFAPKTRCSSPAIFLTIALCAPCLGQTRPGGGRGADVPPGFHTDVPAHTADIILARPTSSSVTLSVLFYADASAFVAYGTDASAPSDRTKPRAFKAGEPGEIVLDSLKPDTQYHYQLRGGQRDRLREGEAPSEPTIVSGRFHTQRPPGSTFTFTIQADSHLDERASPAIYRQALANALADQPDFHIDLGDTFMTEKQEKREDAARQYLAQRYYFGLVGASAPVFLALGNHDGEEWRQYDGTPDSLAVWSATMRRRYFPNPIPDSFYTGDEAKEKFAGLLQDYYAWTWGDALFVVLDPFWYSSRPHGRDDNWSRSLGHEQYKWLARTLEASKARHKFIFIHHLVGGIDNQGRGGIEAAPFYEWGGKNIDGSDGFKARRPGWEAPIHNLLVRNRVTAVFHGHDHFYARQELDGIVYQLVPQPGYTGGDRVRTAEEYGYTHGDIAGGSGHLRVTVSPKSVSVEYVRSIARGDDTPQRFNGQVVRKWAYP